MALPKNSELRQPILMLLSESSETMRIRDFIEPLTNHFNLSLEDVTSSYPTGNGEVFYDKISWSLSYLYMSSLVEKPQRGLYKISPQGREILTTPEKIEPYVQKIVAQRRAKKQPSRKTESSNDSNNLEETPLAALYQSYEDIRLAIYDDILTTILSKTPYEFERLVVQLLQKMGYGGEIKNAGAVTKASNDGGIDGIIKEDVLGLGRIYIQAKRYALDKSISRPDIQKFVGALAVAQSNKGVFITTCNYSKEAIEYANNLNGSATLVLIDGIQLAEHIYHYGLGMQVEQTLEIKKLDTDFWDSMTDDNEK